MSESVKDLVSEGNSCTPLQMSLIQDNYFPAKPLKEIEIERTGENLIQKKKRKKNVHQGNLTTKF